MTTSASTDDAHERNSNTFKGSTVTNSPVVAGSRAQVNVSVGAGSDEPQVTAAIAELRAALEDTRAALDRRDDETREALTLAADRLSNLEEELRAPKAKRDWGRVTKLMSGIRDAVTGLTALTVSTDALWDSIQQVVR
jgi:hypothetical protein